jgi:HlyD family secretion protein
MAEEPKRGLFREKSLERLSSPERLDQLLRVVDRKSWLPLLALGLLVAVAVSWALFGRIPVNVHGKGILIVPREIVEVQSPGAGYLASVRVRVGDVVERGQVLAAIHRPDLETRLELEQGRLADLESQIRADHVLRLTRELREGLPVEQNEIDTDNPLELLRTVAESLRRKELADIAREREKLGEQLREARDLQDSMKRRLSEQRELVQSKILAKHDVIDAQEDYTESLDRVLELEAQMRTLRTQELQVEERYLDRSQRITDREQEIADVRREIHRLERQRDQEASVVSERPGRILEISASAGEFVSPGSRIGAMAVSHGGGPLTSLSYFTVKDGKRLDIGQRIQVTPDPVERERYGSIIGRITEISAFPVTLAEAEEMVGIKGVAETLVSGGYRMQVQAELQRDETTTSQLAWTSSRGPEMAFSGGTTTTVRVAVEQRRPITFVLPTLRAAAGVD